MMAFQGMKHITIGFFNNANVRQFRTMNKIVIFDLCFFRQRYFFRKYLILFFGFLHIGKRESMHFNLISTIL